MGKAKKELPNIAHSFDRCAHLAKELNTTSDRMNKVIQQFNEKLQAISPGVSAWHVYAKTAVKERCLGYSKIGGNWGLSVKIADLPDYKGIEKDKVYEEEVWSLTEAPRWLRLEAISALPEFLETLQKRIAEMSSKTESATAKMQEYLGQLKGDQEK